MSLPKGYFGIQRLNGYSHTLEDGPVKELVYAVDMWIEKNTGLIACMTVSPEFYGRLKAAVGYDVLVLDTIIGDFLLFVHIDAKTPIQITALDEHIQNSESSDILTPKGSPDFSETSYIRDEVKNTCEKITCPVIESVNDQIMKTPLRTAHERIVELEAALNKIANHRRPPMHHSMYEGIARAVLKRGAQ